MTDQEKLTVILDWWNKENPGKEAYSVVVEEADGAFVKALLSLVDGTLFYVPVLRQSGGSALDCVYRSVTDSNRADLDRFNWLLGRLFDDDDP